LLLSRNDLNKILTRFGKPSGLKFLAAAIDALLVGRYVHRYLIGYTLYSASNYSAIQKLKL
jgi:hypothetical protein